jgi:hypothetical protein
MAWNGWMQFGGTEVINVSRTETYCLNDGVSWFSPVYRANDLAAVLGDKPYRSPLQDDAPWNDPDDPDTYGFYGVYPLDVTGLDDSTRSSTIVESVLDGGSPGRIRHTTRQVVFSALLLGDSDASVDAGLRWLRNVLLGAPCTQDGCTGTTMCYFGFEPVYDPSGNCIYPYRTLLNVQVNTGPTVTAKHNSSNGGSIWTVTWTAVAGNPFEFGQEVVIGTNLFSPLDADHRPQGGTVTPPSTPGGVPGYSETSKNTKTNSGGHTVAESKCPNVAYSPLFDPAYPTLVPPPLPPNVPLNGFAPPSNWRRYSLSIPAEDIPLWSDVAPYIAIRGVRSAVHNLRVRFWQDPVGLVDPDNSPCGYCGDFLVTYVPQGGELVIDGTAQTIRYNTPGQSVPAEHLVSDSHGQPFTWPLLSCGTGYLVTFDSLQTQRMPYIDLSLYPRTV